MKRKSPTQVVRSYHADLSNANPGKLALLAPLQQRLALEAQRISSFVERQLFQTGDIRSLAGTLKFPSIPLVAYAQPLYSFVVGQWQSWLSNRRNDFSRLVYQFANDKDHGFRRGRTSDQVEALKLELFVTNRWSLWMVPLDQGQASVTTSDGTVVTFTAEGRALARQLWKIVRHQNRNPSFRHVPIQLDGRMMTLSPKETSQHGYFTHWLELKVMQDDPTWSNVPDLPLAQAIVNDRIGQKQTPKGQGKKRKKKGESIDSTLVSKVDQALPVLPLTLHKVLHDPAIVPAEPTGLLEPVLPKVKRKSPTSTTTILLPVNVYAKAQNAPGTMNGTLSLLPPRPDRSDRQTWKLAFSKTSHVTEWVEPEAVLGGILGFDIGLNTLLATSDGDLIETGWKQKLEHWDNQLTKLVAGRQRHGLKVRCKNYDRLVARIRDGITTRIGQALKGLIERRRPSRVVLENVHFQGGGMSRRMNRLISNFGLGLLKKWFEQHQTIYGYEVEYINPAFTSQECSECHYIDKRNRVGEVFKCKACGHGAHADLQASKTVQGRSRARRGAGENVSPGARQVELWMRPKQVYEVLFKAWWHREAWCEQGRFWSTDGSRAEEFRQRHLEQNPSWQTYGDVQWLASR